MIVLNGYLQDELDKLCFEHRANGEQ